MLLEMENEKKEEDVDYNYKMEDVDYNYKMEDVILPGFRFHPTDEELVGFYLIRKIQQRPLSIELIKQADIYKYDPWDLPKLACNGEKEWYFYCRRDRKYRNSARPNRVVVTGAGFWKATGTDRPIYSSTESVGLGRTKSKCIGLKKSLVFYRGKAAKGIKTDWMMHEFRLPSLSNSMPTPNKLFHAHKNIHIPATNDAWVICKIFKKATTMAQRALCQGQGSDLFNQNIFFSPENISSCRNEITTGASSNGCNIKYFPDLETPSYQQPIYPNEDLSPCFTWLNKNFEHNNNVFEESMNKYYSMSFPQDIDQEKFWEGEWVKKRLSTDDLVNNNNNNVGSIRFPFSLAPTEQPDVWKPKLSS